MEWTVSEWWFSSTGIEVVSVFSQTQGPETHGAMAVAPLPKS